MIHEMWTSGHARFNALATGNTWTVSPIALSMTMHTVRGRSGATTVTATTPHRE